ncbi:restriction endonuclease [Fructobacillus ficulneus]|uniref:Mrr restriction system protein n=1 Tax=Fructobacillus ficulneus TaxID=157463 RepID=A0A0K8MH54_9LACO|nr:restriction endonuclease [Fructobacillus ficulneus]GAO99896.1 Mrr restriction system protein [Fructobacillus ficulneus]
MKSNAGVVSYDTVTSIERENIVMMALLRVLQEEGGKVEKKAARNLLPQGDELITPDVLWRERISKKTGDSYRPFDFTINYTAQRLRLFDCLESSRGKFFVLTEKGLSLDLNAITADEIRAATEGAIKEISIANKKKKQAQVVVESTPDVKPVIEEDESESSDFDETTESWREQLKFQLRQMAPSKFEIFCRELVRKMGAKIDDEIGLQLSQDHGIDGYAYMVNDQFRTTRVAIQAKRYNNQVGDKYIRDFRGSIQNGTDYGILITTDYFSSAAVKEAKDPAKSTPITLLDIDDVVDLVEKYQLFVKKVETYALGDFYYE